MESRSRVNGNHIRLVLIEDSKLFQRKLRGFLDAEDDLEVVGTADDGVEGIRVVQESRPDLVLLDMRLPKASGVDVLEAIMASRPTPVLALTAEPERYGPGEPLDVRSRGGLGILAKPRRWPPSAEEADALLAQIRLCARLPVVRHVRPPGRPGRSGPGDTEFKRRSVDG